MSITYFIEAIEETGMNDTSNTQMLLDMVVANARANHEGDPASYIPELANVDSSLTSVAMIYCNGESYVAGDVDKHVFTLQSVAKLVVLIGLLEECGEELVFSWVGVEASGKAFASISHLDAPGAKPANPLINPGAITLCSFIPGETTADRLEWLARWVALVFGEPLQVNERVLDSERRTGDRNRALAYLLRSDTALTGDVEEILEVYFTLCSYEANVKAAAYLPMLLANGGCTPDGQQIFSAQTASRVVSIMANCGMYDESGIHLVRTGMPAKSGVSGAIVAVSPGRCGIAVSSPRINRKGGSVRGHLILGDMSRAFGLHFALVNNKTA